MAAEVTTECDYKQGSYLYTQKKYQNAAQYFTKTLNYEQTSDYLLKIAKKLVKQKKYDAALSICKQLGNTKAVKKVVDAFGTIDIAANCAGINVACKMIDMTDDLWDRINNIDLKGTLYISQEAAKVMREHKYGHIVNIGSISGKIPEDMNGAYCVAKAGVLMMTKVMALELAEYNINVNAICPGPVNTNIMKEVFEQRGAISGMTPDEFRAFFLRDIPLGRMAEPDDIAELMCFLASDKASYITGVDYTIAGGKIFQ